MPIFPGAVGRSDRVDVWDQEAFRAVDTSVGALVLQLTRALVGLTTAYVVGRILTERWLDLGDGGADVMLATAIHVGLAGLALFLTSARPIRRDLDRAARAAARQRGRDGRTGPAAGLPARPAGRARHGRDRGRRARGHRQGAPGRGAGPGRAPRRRRQPRPPPPRRHRAGQRGARLRGRDAVGLPRRSPGPHPLLREQRRPLGVPAPVGPRRGAVLRRLRPDHDPRHAHRRHPRHRTRRRTTAGPPR